MLNMKQKTKLVNRQEHARDEEKMGHYSLDRYVLVRNLIAI